MEITEQQRAAINNLVQRAAQLQDQSVDSLARAIRPTVGLYTRQAVANLRYYQTVRQSLLDTNSNMRATTAERKAREAAIQYAAKQHRYRAMMIARTELVNAYNHGELGAVKQASREGKLGEMKKRWVTADDDRVCEQCKALAGVALGLYDAFPGGYDAPTAHPHCRCVLIYQEVDEKRGD